METSQTAERAEIPLAELHAHLVDCVGERLLDTYGDIPPDEYAGTAEAFRHWVRTGKNIIDILTFQVPA